MGIYSGRVNERSDIGMVWQCQLLERLFRVATQGTIMNPAAVIEQVKQTQERLA